MDLNQLADSLERFSDVGVVGVMVLVFALIVTGQIYTKGRVDDIKTAYQERIDRLESVIDDFYREQRLDNRSRRETTRTKRPS